MMAWCGGEPWCGATVPTMMEEVAVAQRRRNVFSITRTRTTCSFWSARGEGGGRCIKIFSTAVYVRPNFLIGRSRWQQRCASAKNHAVTANFLPYITLNPYLPRPHLIAPFLSTCRKIVYTLTFLIEFFGNFWRCFLIKKENRRRYFWSVPHTYTSGQY